jgi:hypothetical protein
MWIFRSPRGGVQPPGGHPPRAVAESLFFISNTGAGREVRASPPLALKFKIKLHYDDRNTLVYIKNLLSRLANRDIGVIVDSKNQHESYFSVDKFNDIFDVIIPIFTKYYFTTTKYLDFKDFKTAASPPSAGMQRAARAAEIKRASIIEKRKLFKSELVSPPPASLRGGRGPRKY